MKIGRNFQLLFLVFVVCGVFYPSLFAGINSVDDWRMFQDLEEMARGDWWSLFLPTSGFYYRPLLMLTFLIDFTFWGQVPSFYHLGNIFIHAANVGLVFWVTDSLHKLARPNEEPGPWPLLAGLLFAVHPIVTESVDWISGRTDLLGCFFVLLATRALVAACSRQQIRFVLLGILAAMLAIMSKEIMVFFLPAGAFMLCRLSPVSLNKAWCRRSMTVFLTPFVFMGGLYFALRTWRYGLGSGFSYLLHRYDYSLFDTVRVFFKAFGFYIKKLFFPLPLNFAIVSASDAYVWLGIASAVAMLFMLRRRHTGVDLILAGFYLVFPGVLIALTNIAWTPLAERYIYLSTVFVVMGLVHLLRDFSSRMRREPVFVAGVAVLLLPMTVATVERNFVWQDNALLYADTEKKSPDFSLLDNELAVALIDRGDLTRAEAVLARGKKSADASPLLYINQARIYVARKEFAKARSEILQICKDKRLANLDALKMLAKIDEMMAYEGENIDLHDLADTYRVLATRSNDPFYDYKYAKLLYKFGRKKDALVYFRNAFYDSNEGAYYRPAAEKYMLRLQAEIQ
ncbi:MAG: hypothetical protein D6694_10825 [Gammaproteobacteria bacterium]|nr:MAG: hypothetical protein D6694_10825 [Gammaproteobacteria bacterium]